jgi:hypothetical protein
MPDDLGEALLDGHPAVSGRRMPRRAVSRARQSETGILRCQEPDFESLRVVTP